ncbi:histidine kinase [Nibricoccus aquaticus]|uniref:histidine kinase n=1 Tax=Nibricoccus aquaticus TaxID=2576891 RepID=UPI0015869B3E|nr:histidine kinase [Nibricoccus aquaticus]
MIPLPFDRSLTGAVVASLLSLLVSPSAFAAELAETTVSTLTTAAEVRSLSVEAASAHHPVTIRGVVTAAEPDWGGKYVVQDNTAGLFVQHVGRQPAIGDVIEVKGTTGPGWFVPVIQSTEWKKLGTSPLPPAKQVSIERLMAGVEASQRIEITGLVRSVTYVPSQKTMVEVSLGGYRVRVFPKLHGNLNPRSLIAAKVRVRGTAATSFNAARRQLTAVNLMVPTADDFVVLEPELHSPWEQPAVPLADVSRFRPNATLGDRVHVKGTLTFQRPGLDLFIQDQSGGLHVETVSTGTLPLGRKIEAVGFLEFVNYQPVLKDAVFNELPEPPETIHGERVSVAELREGLHGAELIVLRGTLMARSVRPVLRENSGFVGTRTVCTLRGEDDQSIIVEYEEPRENPSHQAIPIGSEIEVTGVAYYETSDTGKPKSINLLLPTPDHLRVLKTPSWFTAERLFIGFAAVCVLLAGSAVWLLTVAKKNAMLGILVSEREKAQKELQEAHDQLEVRVKERTEQLKLEMTVRKSAEVEFRAVLTERTRLARELHDTLEQALTGIALQLDTASKLFQRNPADASQPLELARGFLHQSQIELRRSIWDLRSRELEQFDLSEALAIASRQISGGTGIAIELDTTGQRRRLPEIVEENLLRIAQEAMTNVVKHAGASRVMVRLIYAEKSVSVEIKDNGGGLNAEKMATQGDRHFGLLGMSERAKRLNGRLDVSGTPGEGTSVRVIIPLDELATPTVAPVSARVEIV